MKSKLLFPHWCQLLGYLFLLVALLGYFIDSSYDNGGIPNGPVTPDNEYLVFQGSILAIVIGLFLVVFSKERIEDEQISRLRLDSLLWAFYMFFILLIICLVFNDGHHIGPALHFVSRFTPVFFIIRFRWVIFRLKQSMKNDTELV